MPGPTKFEIRYVSPSIVRCEDNEFALQYVDDQGELTFSGFEAGHASGGMLYFPTAEEWDAFLPKRGGQRSKVLERLFDFGSKKGGNFGFILPSLLEPGFFARWPKERDYLRKDPSPDEVQRIVKAMLAIRCINSTMAPPAVSRVAFDRPFRVENFKGTVDVLDGPIRNVVLRSDQTPGHPSRVEIQFLMVAYQKIPPAFDGVTVEDVTDTATLLHNSPERLDRHRLAVQVPGEPVWCLADESQLRQVVISK